MQKNIIKKSAIGLLAANIIFSTTVFAQTKIANTNKQDDSPFGPNVKIFNDKMSATEIQNAFPAQWDPKLGIHVT